MQQHNRDPLAAKARREFYGQVDPGGEGGTLAGDIKNRIPNVDVPASTAHGPLARRLELQDHAEVDSRNRPTP
jgi:hypothetical protein